MDKPKVGTVLWSVKEHFHDRPRPLAGTTKEYVIRKATVRGYIKGGYTEICTLEESCSELDEKGKTPCYYKLSMLDKEWIFRDRREAAMFAKKKTDEEDERDRRTAEIIHRPFEPMRRTWEVFLEDANEKEIDTKR